jgi:hypothetical protein
MYVPIDFDKPRKLRFDIPAVQELEHAMNGQPLGLILQHLSQMGVNAFVLSLYIGLKHEDKGLTPKLVTKMLERYIKGGGKLATLGKKIEEALLATGLFASDDDADTAEGNVPAESAAIQG